MAEAVSDLAIIRAMSTALTNRNAWMGAAGRTFHGKRDLYRVLGYKDTITPADYRFRYERDGVAKRIVDTFPDATWRGGAEVLENEDKNNVTPFEKAAEEFIKKMRLWNVFSRHDKASRIGHYAVMLIGTTGKLEDPILDDNGKAVKKLSIDDILYLAIYSEEDATIASFEQDYESPRFGLPLLYNLRRTSINANQRQAFVVNRVVHWSRVIHLADDVLDDPVNGPPALQCVWNRLDDLEKVTGGGAEAFWKRADQGLQINIDKDLVKFEPDSQKALEAQVEEYIHGLRRVLQTRGVEVNSLGSDVADFNSPAQAIFDQLSASTGIPQRILMGAERGELASSADESNFDDRVQDRRTNHAHPNLVQPFFELMITLGVLPEPKDFFTQWPEIKNLNDNQRADIAMKWAQICMMLKKGGETPAVQPNEIRENILGLRAFTPEEQAAQLKQQQEEQAKQQQQTQDNAKSAADIAVKQQHGLPQDATSQEVRDHAQATKDAIAAKAAADVAKAKENPFAKTQKAASLHVAVAEALDTARRTLESPALRAAMRSENPIEVRRILKESFKSIRAELDEKVPAAL